MPQLTRRRSIEAREERWHVYHGDIHAGIERANREGLAVATRIRDLRQIHRRRRRAVHLMKMPEGSLRPIVCVAAPNIDPIRRPTLTPVQHSNPELVAALVAVWVGSTLSADWGSKAMPIHI
jgi:hypothetical protein